MCLPSGAGRGRQARRFSTSTRQNHLCQNRCCSITETRSMVMETAPAPTFPQIFLKLLWAFQRFRRRPWLFNLVSALDGPRSFGRLRGLWRDRWGLGVAQPTSVWQASSYSSAGLRKKPKISESGKFCPTPKKQLCPRSDSPYCCYCSLTNFPKQQTALSKSLASANSKSQR